MTLEWSGSDSNTSLQWGKVFPDFTCGQWWVVVCKAVIALQPSGFSWKSCVTSKTVQHICNRPEYLHLAFLPGLGVKFKSSLGTSPYGKVLENSGSTCFLVLWKFLLVLPLNVSKCKEYLPSGFKMKLTGNKRGFKSNVRNVSVDFGSRNQLCRASMSELLCFALSCASVLLPSSVWRYICVEILLGFFFILG